MWWACCFVLTLFFASFAVQAEFNVDKSSEVRAEKDIHFQVKMPIICHLIDVCSPPYFFSTLVQRVPAWPTWSWFWPRRWRRRPRGPTPWRWPSASRRPRRRWPSTGSASTSWRRSASTTSRSTETLRRWGRLRVWLEAGRRAPLTNPSLGRFSPSSQPAFCWD